VFRAGAYNRVHLEQLLERVDADPLSPTEQLAAAVDDALDHRQQKLLIGATCTGTLAFALFFIRRLVFSHLCETVLCLIHSQVCPEPPLLTQINFAAGPLP
jgi:hypothetical protein